MYEIVGDVKGLYRNGKEFIEVILRISRKATNYRLKMWNDTFNKEFLFKDSFDLFDYIHKNFILYL